MEIYRIYRVEDPYTGDITLGIIENKELAEKICENWNKKHEEWNKIYYETRKTYKNEEKFLKDNEF